MENMVIKNLYEKERPYEKLEQKGARYLTDAELLAIILKTGTKSMGSVQLAHHILCLSERGISGIHTLSLENLKEIKGIGRVKAIQLKALAEISARIAKGSALLKFKVDSPERVADIYMEEMRYYPVEHFKVVYLDTKNHIIYDEDLTIGTVNMSLIHPREVFIKSLHHNAVSIILLHNHPSGDPSPSDDDIQVTARIARAGELLGIHVIDHLIIGDGRFYSFKQNDKL